LKSKREIASGLLILAIATVFGQQTPPQDQSKTDDQNAQAAKTPPPLKLDVDLGWSAWGLSGNENKFRQYATAPKGLFIRDLSYQDTFLGKNDAMLDAKSPWQDDFLLNGIVRLNSGMTYIDASEQRNRFFDPDPSVLTGNERLLYQGGIRQKVTQNFGVSFQENFDEQQQNFSAPYEPLNQKTRIWNGAGQGSLWKDGFVDLSYTNIQYWDRTEVLPDTNTQTWNAGLMQQIGDTFSVNGSVAQSLIRQPGVGTDKSSVDAWSAGGEWLLGDSTSLIGQMQNEKINLPTVQNAFDKQRDMAHARLVHSFGGGWSAQFGYSKLAIERVNADHTNVDNPTWHTFDVQLTGRLSPSVRLTAKGSRETMQGVAQMETDDPLGLYWSNRWNGEIKLDATSDQINSYVVFGIHEDRNDARDVNVRNQNLTYGATFEVQPQLEFYVESSYDLWSGNTTDPANPNLGQFFPDGTTFTTGTNWTMDEHTYLSANYTLFNTNNDNPLGLPGGNVRGNFFSGSVHYKSPSGYEFGLTFAPWQYSDRLYQGMGYNTGLIQLTARAKF